MTNQIDVLGPLIIDIQGTKLSVEDAALICHKYVAGIIFFARNYQSPQQMRELVAEIREVRPALLLCVDQEGGRVQRFKQGLTTLPALGTLPKLAKRNNATLSSLVVAHARLMAAELIALGIDFSFAPVVDVNYGHNQVIADRAFAGTPQKVADCASLYIRELQSLGMAAIAKHFPGHGFVREDTHVERACDFRTKQQLLAEDGLPFVRAIKEEVAGIMPAHVIYSEVDDLPAVQSAVWQQQILRQQLGFSGAIISDDLSMAGAGGDGVEQRVEGSITAGCDLCLVCNDRNAQLRALAHLEKMPLDLFKPDALVRRSALRLRKERQLPNREQLDQARSLLGVG